MAYVAQLNADRICTSVAELETVPDGELFVVLDSMDRTLLGRHHDGQDWGAALTPVAARHITKLAFWSRFTAPERVAILTAAKASVAVEDYIAMVKVANFIDLDRADTRAGVQALETATLLAPGRALVILDAAIEPHEKA